MVETLIDYANYNLSSNAESIYFARLMMNDWNITKM